MTESLPMADGGSSPLPSTSAAVASPPRPDVSAVPSAARAAAAPLAGSPADVTDNAAQVPTAPSTGGARSRATPEDPVYLNEATLADLHRLPGVGPKRAEAILALRARLGHFRQVEDLLKVKGIGRSSLRKLRPLIRLDPPPAKSPDAGIGDAHAALYDSAPFTRAISAPTPPSFRSMCS
jgi:competence protein ComEA